MLTVAGVHILAKGQGVSTPGATIHEMGTAHMGTDPRTSVLDKYSQARCRHRRLVANVRFPAPRYRE